MSDLDRENLRDEQTPLARKDRVNESDTGGASAQKTKKKKIIWGVLILLIIVIVILAIVLPLTLKGSNDDNGDPFSSEEFNLYSVDQSTYSATVWKAEFQLKQSAQTKVTKAPTEFMKLMDSRNGGSYRPANPQKIVNGSSNNWADTVKFNIDLIDNYQARILIKNNDYTDPQLIRVMVNESVFPRPVTAWEARLSQLDFKMSNESFYFSFGNIYTQETVLSTQNRKLLVSDFYSEIGFVLPSQRCYGLGQRNGKFSLSAGMYTLHSKYRDQALQEDDQLGDKSGNHIHPFILCQTQSKDFFGMFFVSNAPQAFEIVQFPNQQRQVLNYITVGGPLEIYTIMRGTASDIIKKYHAMIGYSQMPPYYALGVYQGSNSYNSWTQVSNIYTQYKTNSQAIEGVFVEDYNPQPHYSYSVNTNTFPDLATQVAGVHANNQRIVFGTSQTFHNASDNYYYGVSKSHAALIDSAEYMHNGSCVTGILDQTSVQYLDSFHPGMAPFLTEVLPEFNTSVGVFDGINVQNAYGPNHVSGEVDPDHPFGESDTTPKKRLLALKEENIGSYSPYKIDDQIYELPGTYDLPFLPSFDISGHLDNMTISLNGSHAGKQYIPNIFVHNAMAHSAVKKTYAVLVNNSDSTTKRPMLFTDASWAGSGAFSIALVTNLYRDWTSLKNVVNQAFGLSMYGFSNTMIDVCGSLGPLDEELCARYMQLAAYMPMARNYYNKTYVDPKTGVRTTTPGSEPYSFINDDYSAAYQGGVADRLSISRYIDSQMYLSYREGGSLVKPLFFDYPEDDQCYNDIESTYMLGDSLKVSPVLTQGVKDKQAYDVYFPAGVWIDLKNSSNVLNLTEGKKVSLSASFAQTNVHLKGGKIIPYQANNVPQLTTTDLQKNEKMAFKIARDSSNSYAEGYVLVDDGETYRSYVDEKYTFWKLRYAEKSINFWVQYGNFNYEPENLKIHQLEKIEILNAADLSSTDFACYLGRNLNPIDLTYDYNDDTQILTLRPTTSEQVITFKDIGFIKFGDSSKEPNFCTQSSAFTYNGTKSDTSNDTYWRYDIKSKLGNDLLKPLVVEFQLLDDQGTFNVEFTTLEDFEKDKTIIYRVPSEVYTLSAFQATPVTKKLENFIDVTADPFAYKVYKDKTDTTTLLWESDPNHLYFDQYFIMDSGKFTANPDNGKPLLGMGERAGSLFFKNEDGGIHSRYTFDQANPIDDGLPPGRNFYGYQPFYAFQSSIATKDWFGVFDVNSYATDYILYSDIGDNKTTQIHKIAIGGTINKFFFIGTKIDDVIKKYQMLVGNPTVPPIWAFGWQQCRFGYVTSQDWYDVYTNYTKFDLPLDVMWADIDYMDDYKLFTIAPQSYGDLPEKVKTIKADGRYFVPIMDAGVAVRENQNYKTLDDGLAQNVFIMKSDKSAPLTAGVWCGNAYFPDFFKPETVTWWKANFEYLYSTDNGGYGLQFDGVWLDENEATNFCNGYCKSEERPADSLRNKPFYVPGWRDLEDKALGVDGWHDSIGRHEYDVHNLYALMQSKATAEFLKTKLSTKKDVNARPYVLTRSNYPGIGKYAHHWMGDNWSTVEYMALSVDGVFSYNLFGLPFMGSDICGFNGDAPADLCTKWHQLGSLYPFSRNHNQNASRSQEPYRFNTPIAEGSTTTYTDVIRTALVNRYSFIKYYYSAFHQIGGYGGSFFKPLFYEFQDDVKTFDDMDLKNNILLGEGLKASINTQTLDFTNVKTTDFYFPAAKWCQIVPYIDPSKCWDTTTTGAAPKTQTLNSGLEDYYIHLRGGYIIPFQNATDLKIRKTKDLDANPTDLLILANDANADIVQPTGTYNGVAGGYIYFDDGITEDSIGRFDIYANKVDANSFTVTVKATTLTRTKGDNKNEQIGKVTFLWASKTGLSGMKKAEILSGGTTVALADPVYDDKSDTLTVTVSDATTTYSYFDTPVITVKTA